MNTNSIAKSLNPIHNLDGKNNFQEFILVDRNGKTSSRIILFIPDAQLREEIICVHFLTRHVQLFLEQTVGVKYISRDKPWDFEIELSNTDKLIIEITSIADEIDLFKAFKYQERLIEKSNYEKIELHELIKLNSLFPDYEIERQIEKHIENKLQKTDLVPNPHFKGKFLFQSSIREDLDNFEKILKESIEKKVNKNHSEKERVVLIIDNRTVSFDMENIVNHLNTLDDYFEKLPFKEVWLYTGYYSDYDGNNAEYSFIPLKIEDEKFEKLISKLKE
jgi:hypothetical protein